MPPDEVVVAPATPATVPVEAKKDGSPTFEEITASLAANMAKGAAPEAVDPNPEPVVAAPVVPVTPKVDPASARFAALARRERETREREAETKRRYGLIEIKQKEIEEREARIKGAKTPLEVLKAHGFAYQDATMEAVGAFTPKPIDPVEQQFQERLSPFEQRQQALEKKLEEASATIQQLQSDRVAGVERQVMTEIQQAATEGGYEYTLAAGKQGLDLVKEVALANLKKNGRLLTYQEALDIVEAHFTKTADAFAATSKMKSRLVPTATVPPKQTTPVITSKAKEPTKTRTLTQAHSAGTPVKQDLDKLGSREALDWLAANVLKYN